MKTLTALGKKAKGLGALGSNFIDEHYTNAARNEDFMGMPERQNPVYAEARKPYKDPAKFVVNESDHFKAVRKQLQWVAEFRNHVKLQDLLTEREPEPRVPRYVPFLAPPEEVILSYHAAQAKIVTDAEQRKAEHAAFVAKERADMAARRLMRLLNGV